MTTHFNVFFLIKLMAWEGEHQLFSDSSWSNKVDYTCNGAQLDLQLVPGR